MAVTLQANEGFGKRTPFAFILNSVLREVWDCTKGMFGENSDSISCERHPDGLITLLGPRFIA
jgi:hypothetical protein